MWNQENDIESNLQEEEQSNIVEETKNSSFMFNLVRRIIGLTPAPATPAVHNEVDIT